MDTVTFALFSIVLRSNIASMKQKSATQICDFEFSQTENNYIRNSNFHGSVFQININSLNLGHVNSDMFCEITLLFEIFIALFALERPVPCVRPHVALQITRRSASEVALVTLVWLFSCCMLTNHVFFQIASRNA